MFVYMRNHRMAILLMTLSIGLVSIVYFIHNISIENPRPATTMDSELSRATSLRARLTDEIITINKGDPDFTLALQTLSQIFDHPVPPNNYGNYWMDIDIFDDKGNTFLSFKLYPNNAILINSQYYAGLDVNRLYRIFDERYYKLTYIYPDGSKRAEGIHGNGQKHGPWTFYYRNGKKDCKVLMITVKK